MIGHSYGYTALKDVRFLYEIGVRPYNAVVVILQQIVEKMLKYVISIECASSPTRDAILEVHSLKKLFMYVSSVHPVDYRQFVVMGDLSYHYTASRYPIEGYSDISDEVMKSYVNHVNEFLLWVVKTMDIQSLAMLACEWLEQPLPSQPIIDALGVRKQYQQLLLPEPLRYYSAKS